MCSRLMMAAEGATLESLYDLRCRLSISAVGPLFSEGYQSSGRLHRNVLEFRNLPSGSSGNTCRLLSCLCRVALTRCAASLAHLPYRRR